MGAGNDAQIEFWNGSGGETWVRAQARLDAMLAPISDAVLDHAGALDGRRILDVGCGRGHVARSGGARRDARARRRRAMLELARTRADGDARLEFSVADAATAEFAADRDLILSRFGVMFFADPVAAFANLRTALTDDGRLCFVCWQAPRANAWVSVVGAAVQPLLPTPDVPTDPKAPGHFAFADPAYVEGLLTEAGFSDVALTAFVSPLRLAGDLDGSIEFHGQVGPGAVLSSRRGVAEAIAAARTALEPHLVHGLHLGAAWVISGPLSNTARR